MTPLGMTTVLVAFIGGFLVWRLNPIRAAGAFLAFLLLRYADVIATKLFPRNASAVPEGTHPTDEWYVLALTVLGVALLVWYLPASIATCVYNFLFSAASDTDLAAQLRGPMRLHAWKALLHIIMQLGLGLYLVLGARGIATCVRKLRRE